jgi:uncharacterized membrane protein
MGRPSARAPIRDRLPRALKEFALLPVLVVLALLVLAALSIVGDQAHGPFVTGVRHVLGHFIGAKSASSTLAAIATGLVTVTSITFSVLLLAVQQTASSLSPVVFDQFVRRRSNQIYLGLFVGLALFSYVVMAAVQSKTPPIIGAFIATVLTVVALACLLFLVYSTIDQMRPDNVIRMLHDRAVFAHDRETQLVERTLRHPRSTSPVQAELHSPTYGFIEAVHLDRIASAVSEDREAEVELCVSVGQAVAVGELIGRVRHRDADAAAAVRSAMRDAVTISPSPDSDYDPRTALRSIRNITWSSGSTAKHNPAIADKGLHALRDLASRWLVEGDRTGPDPLPVVYPDGDVISVLDALYACVVAAAESHQYQQAIQVLNAYAFLWPRSHGCGPRQDRPRCRGDAIGPRRPAGLTGPACSTRSAHRGDGHRLAPLTPVNRSAGTAFAAPRARSPAAGCSPLRRFDAEQAQVEVEQLGGEPGPSPWVPGHQRGEGGHEPTARQGDRLRAAGGVGQAVVDEVRDPPGGPADRPGVDLFAQRRHLRVHEGLVVQHGEEAEMLRVGVQVGARGRPGHRDRVVAVEGAELLGLDEPVPDLGRDGGERLLLGGEVDVERRPGDAGITGDVGDRRTRVTAGLEDAPARHDERPVGGAGLAVELVAHRPCRSHGRSVALMLTLTSTSTTLLIPSRR